MRALILMALAACVGVIRPSVASATVTLLSQVRATGTRSEGYQPALGYPMTVVAATGSLELRGAWEYSLASAPQQFMITSISFGFRTAIPMGLPFQSKAYFYAGDGVMAAEDFLETDLLFGTAPSIEHPQWYTVSTSKLAEINAALGNGRVRHMGFVLVGTFAWSTIIGDRVDINWVEVPAPSPAGMGVVAAACGIRFRARRA